TGVCESGNRRAPEDVLARFAIPFIWQVLSFCNTRSVWPAKRRPASFVTRHRTSRRTCFRHVDDLSRRHRDYLGRRDPRAAIDNHLSRHAVVCDDVERNMIAVGVEVILTRTIAAAWATTHRQFDLISVDTLPGSVHF